MYLICKEKFFHEIKIGVAILLGNPKEYITVANPNTCTEVKLCLFLFMSALEAVCSDTEVFKTVSSKSVRMDLLENLSLQIKRKHGF